MEDVSQLTEAVFALANRLLDDNVSEGKIAEAGGMRRQSINARGLRRTTGNIGRLGLGFCVLRAAAQYGRPGEALELLFGRTDLFDSTAIRAAFLFPDLKSHELAAIERIEETVGVNPLPDNLLRNLIETMRAPKS